MKAIIAILFIGLFGLLGACAPTGASIRAGQPAPDRDNEADDGFFDTMADGIVKADTKEGRKLRVCFFAMAVAEAYTFRLQYYGAGIDQKSVAYAAVLRLSDTVDTLKESGDTLFARTRMFYVGVDLIRTIEGPLRDRALATLTSAVSLNWKGLARGLRQGLGQGGLISVMVMDARDAADLYDKKVLTREDAWSACQGRIRRNLGILAGAIGVEAPAPLRLPS